MEEFEYLGEWWLPDQPNHRLGGTLRFSPENGLHLTVVGQLGREAADNADDEPFPVILGNALDAGRVTLVNCSLSRSKYHGPHGSPWVKIREYRAVIGYLGAHLAAKESRRFRSAYLEYTHLFEWVGISGFDRPEPTQPDDIEVATITHRSPSAVTAQVNAVSAVADVDMQFWFGLSEGWGVDERTLKESCSAHFESAEPWSVNQWLHHIVSPFRDFLTFATSRSNAITRYRVPIPGEHEQNSDHEVQIVFPSDVSADADKRLLPFEMLLPYGKIASRFPELLNTWMGFYGSIDSVIRLYMLTRYQKGKFPLVEAEFLIMVQALESFHRRLRPSEKEPEGVFLQRLERLQAAISADDWSRLGPALEYANEKSLSTRLKDLIVETEVVKWRLVRDRKRFVRGVVDTRNFFTHFSKTTEERRLQVPDLLDTLDILKVMLEVLILHELGFSNIDAHEMTQSSRLEKLIGKRQVLGED